MTDSNAVRSRRKRLHAANDHSICTGRCRARRPGPALAAVPPDNVRSLDAFNPRAELAALAGRLIEAHTEDPGNAGLARETRATLLALAGAEEPVDPDLADLFRTLDGA